MRSNFSTNLLMQMFGSSKLQNIGRTLSLITSLLDVYLQTSWLTVTGYYNMNFLTYDLRYSQFFILYSYITESCSACVVVQF